MCVSKRETERMCASKRETERMCERKMRENVSVFLINTIILIDSHSY